MASQFMPIRAAAFTFEIPGVYSQADPTIFQVAPTIAAGDFWISTDGGGWNALTNTPTVIIAGSVDTMIQFVLTATEMTADRVAIKWVDAAGAEWISGGITFYTSARGADDLAYPTVSGRSIDVSATGEVGLDWANIGSPTTVQGLSGTTVKTATDVETDTQDIQARLPAALVGGRIAANAEVVGDKTGYALTAAYDPAKTAAQAGNAMSLVVDALDSTALATTAVTEIVNAVWALASRSLPAAEREAVADALLARRISGGANTGRTVTSALRRIRNKVDLTAPGSGTGTVYQEDDTTADHTFAYATATRNPLASASGG